MYIYIYIYTHNMCIYIYIHMYFQLEDFCVLNMYLSGTKWSNMYLEYSRGAFCVLNMYLSGATWSNSKDVEANILNMAGRLSNSRKYAEIRNTIRINRGPLEPEL